MRALFKKQGLMLIPFITEGLSNFNTYFLFLGRKASLLLEGGFG
jgi:hypothetical protein